MSTDVGKKMTIKKPVDSVYRPLERYTNSCDTHFKYSVYNMKRDTDNTAV